MGKLIIIRHGESVGNKKGIIQSKEGDPGLTLKGKNEIRAKTIQDLGVLKGAKRIVVSDYKRAIETAKIVFEETGIPIVINSNIGEVRCGILEGLSKDVAKKEYPEYYEIYSLRNDLDDIPNAESGEELQARAIGFLMSYYGKQDFSDIVVTHAGFIRCLLNTMMNRERTYRFLIENGTMIQVDDLFEKMNMQSRDRAMNSKVIIVNTPNGKYVVKIKKGSIGDCDYAEKDLLEAISLDSLPVVLSMQNYEDGRYCKVIRHIEGHHEYGKLSNEKYDALIKAEEELEKALVEHKDSRFKTRDLQAMLNSIYCNSSNTYVKQTAHSLLKSPYSSLLSNSKEYVLSHNDLNRDNILFDVAESGETRVNFIDFESIEYAPKDYQFASMLASGLLLEGESYKKIEDTIKSRGFDIDKILYFMQIRVLNGLSFFAEQKNRGEGENEVSKDLLKRYFAANEIIQKKRNRFIEQEEMVI